MKLPKKLQLVNNTKEVREYRASFGSNGWFAINNGKIYPIKVSKDKCNELRYIFSSAKNDYYPKGTVRSHEKLFVENYEDFGMWEPFREGFIFKGVLIQGQVIPDWKDHQVRARKEYGKVCSRSIKQ